MTRWEVSNLPLGQVLDQIACWQIAECGEKEKPHAVDIFDIRG